MNGMSLAVRPIIDHGQYQHEVDPKDRIIENLKADVRIRDREIERLTTQIEKAKVEKIYKQELRAKVKEITARVAWYLPGTTSKQEKDGRYRLRVPIPRSGVELHFLTPVKGSKEWTSEHWWTGTFTGWPREEGKQEISDNGNDHLLGDTPEEIAEAIILDFAFDDGALYHLNEEVEGWYEKRAERRKLKREAAA